jgi:hypothetical protein
MNDLIATVTLVAALVGAVALLMRVVNDLLQELIRLFGCRWPRRDGRLSG